MIDLLLGWDENQRESSGNKWRAVNRATVTRVPHIENVWKLGAGDEHEVFVGETQCHSSLDR